MRDASRSSPRFFFFGVRLYNKKDALWKYQDANLNYPKSWTGPIHYYGRVVLIQVSQQ